MATEPRIVIDTNTYVSRLLAPGSVPARAVDRAMSEALTLVSEATMEELADVLSRRKFDPYVSLEERKTFLRFLGGMVEVVPITRRFRACRDPKDDKFLDVAVNGEATTIITGDADLLALDPFQGVTIVKPAQYMQR
jgi:putative PIN family toxin of toxin-antitoxin system